MGAEYVREANIHINHDDDGWIFGVVIETNKMRRDNVFPSMSEAQEWMDGLETEAFPLQSGYDCGAAATIMPAQRIQRALDFAVNYGSIDGDWHKAWVIDQMVRALTGCPMVEVVDIDCNGKPVTPRNVQGESDEYRQLVLDTCDGDDGPDTYSWDCGTPP